MDGKVEWNPPSKQIAEECERNGDLTEGCVYNKMMDNFANNCPSSRKRARPTTRCRPSSPRTAPTT